MATVIGTPGNDTNLRGTWADDTIDGGLGADIMSGGGGNDIYIVNNLGDVVRETPTFKIYNNTAIQLVSVNGSTLSNSSSGVNAVTVSGTGNLVAFYTQASNLVAGDLPGSHEFVLRNMTTGALTFLEVASGAGTHVDQPGGDNGYSAIHITPNGRYVVFSSTSPELDVLDDTTDSDIFVRDLQTGTITIESTPYGAGVSADYHTWAPDISGNGRYVVFSSSEDLVGPNDANGVADSDVFWRDRQTGELRMVSGEFDGSVQGNSDSDNATVTDNGRFVLFESSATNFILGGDTNGSSDLFVRDMVNDTLQVITASADGTEQANGSSYDGQITPNGHYVVFTSGADNLIEGTVSSSTGIYRQDLTTGNVVRADSTSTGAVTGNGQHAQITPDGRFVVFESTATTLVPVAGDLNNITKIFVKDLVTGQIEMVSRTVTGGALTGFSAYAPQISDDGRFIVFNTRTDLNVQDSGTVEDVYRVPNPLYSPGDEVRSSVTFTLPTDVENLLLTGTLAINGTGNTLRNVITGNTNNNILDGSAGNDTLNGGTGNDVLIGGTGIDALAGGNGTDTASYAAATAAVTVNLALTAAQNTVGAGTDTLATIENLTGSAFNDHLTGNTANNTLIGGSGNDTMNGSSGNDILVGQAGADVLTGGLGADRFDFNSVGDTGITNTTRDRIQDFVRAQADKIDLANIDANSTVAGDQVFQFIGGAAFSGNATGKLRFDAVNHLVLGSTDADTAAEFSIQVNGLASMLAADFIL